jgi:hypothetical protein
VRRIVVLVAVVLLCAGAVAGRSLYEGSVALAAGDAALARGDRRAAIAAWQRAERWAVPGAPHVAAARAHLAAHHAPPPRAPSTPSGGWTLVALLGLGLWLGGAAHFARRGLDAGERLVSRDAGAAAALVTVGLVTWMVGLYSA